MAQSSNYCRGATQTAGAHRIIFGRTHADAGTVGTLIFIAREILLSMSHTCEEYTNNGGYSSVSIYTLGP